MSRCWLQGELRAWLDRELFPLEMEAIERHLPECRHCSALSAELSARAARVGEAIAALDGSPVVAIRRRRRPVIAALAAAAATLLLLLGQAGSLRRTVSPPVTATQDLRYYVALDDEPIESGVIVRVTLPDTGLLADVIFDEQGRPRAVRPLN
jgi:ferric-dicitrate binding protein FerR (iron transport regulator)